MQAEPIRQSRQRSGCTVRTIFPSAADNAVNNAVLSILMESYEERLENSFACLTSRAQCATMVPAP